jgi:hypothetical protein
MNLLLVVLAWLVLLAVAWPLALVVLVLFPLVWVIALPFRLVGIVVGAALALLKALLALPARVLGHRG